MSFVSAFSPVLATTTLASDGGNLVTTVLYAAGAGILVGIIVMVGEGFFQRKAIITMLHAACASLGAAAIVAAGLTWYNGIASPVQAAVASTWGTLPNSGGQPSALTLEELDRFEKAAARLDAVARRS